MDTVVLTKGGPRLIDLYRKTNHLRILVTGPRMLFERLDLMTNLSAIDGATVDFFNDVAAGLHATVAGSHESIREAEITVAFHRLGAEVSIEVGPPNMFQSQLDIYTKSGESFRELIDEALPDGDNPFASDDPIMVVLVAVRATGHHEHHRSAQGAIKRQEPERKSGRGGKK